MILGIDIAKGKFDVALYSGKELVASGSFENNHRGFKKLSKWLAKKAKALTWACMESTGLYGDELAYYLYEAGHAVSIVNPVRIRKYTDSKLVRQKSAMALAAIKSVLLRTNLLSVYFLIRTGLTILTA